jgi:transcriptional regulator with XRE-family HTH domain
VSTAEKIKQFREEKEWSQEELAKKTNNHFNQSQISKIEKGIRKITDNDIRVLAQALGVAAKDLI